MRESDVEEYFVKQWEAIGGVTRKLKYIGRKDCPDRLASVPEWQGLVELKRPKKDARATQAHEFDVLRASGLKVEVLNTFEKVNSFIHKIKLKRKR